MVVILGKQDNMVTKLGSAIVIGNPSTNLLDGSGPTKMPRTGMIYLYFYFILFFPFDSLSRFIC